MSKTLWRTPTAHPGYWARMTLRRHPGIVGYIFEYQGKEFALELPDDVPTEGTQEMGETPPPTFLRRLKELLS